MKNDYNANLSPVLRRNIHFIHPRGSDSEQRLHLQTQEKKEKDQKCRKIH